MSLCGLSDMNSDQKALIIIASNRGPFSFHKQGNKFSVERGAGGLVTALGALAERHEVLWVASAMSDNDRLWSQHHGGKAQTVEGIHLKLVEPKLEDYEGYYNEIANPMLWFIQHQLWDIPREPSITESTWNAWDHGYKPVNKLFAEAIAEAIEETDRPVIVLPQDYHLYMTPHYLREVVGERVQIQPFVHIPWPGPDAWRILPQPMRDAMLSSLLESDRVGFQTEKDAFNFVQCCRFYLGAHAHGRRDAVEYKGRDVGAVSYPISIDVEKLRQLADEQVTRLERSQLLNTVGERAVILRVDRIEPSKNNLRGLQAVMINARYSDSIWEPVRIVVGDNYHRAIAAMQLYDLLLVNPIADGMNLVAKEGVLVNRKNGVLLLSEFAGAFYELGQDALTVSPFDVYGTAEAMHQALTMTMEERTRRATALREIVVKKDVREWFAAQVDDALRAMRTKP